MMNAGITISNLLQLILLISIAINEPTIIKTGAVTSSVMTESKGEKNSVIKKQMETIIEVNPVRPPTAIPAVDSTNKAVVDVPKIAPSTPDVESATRAFPALVILLSFIKPVLLATAINAPAVSKKATIKNVKITAMISGEKISSR